MKSLAVAALVLGLAGSARAEEATPGRTSGPWFVGASTQFIRDGRVGRYDFHSYDGPTGLGYGFEAGRRLLPWLSISLIGRRSSVSEVIWTDPGNADFSERQLVLGPRVDLWPVRDRIRIGFAVVRSWRRTERDFSKMGGRLFSHASSDVYEEAQVGLVALRRSGFELELSGSLSREPIGEEGELLSTFSVGLGLRWRNKGAPRPAGPSPAATASAGRPSS